MSVACQALKDGTRLSVLYDGHARIVEAHAIGRSQGGDLLMLVWQVRGGSASRKAEGWKLLRLDAVQFLEPTQERSQAPRPGYRRGQSALQGEIICEV